MSEPGFMGFSDLHDYGTCDESHYYKQEGEYQQYYSKAYNYLDITDGRGYKPRQHSKAYNYLDITDGRGYKPRQRWSRIGTHERGRGYKPRQRWSGVGAS